MGTLDSKSWSRLSIRRKVMYWLGAVVLVMAGLVILTDAARQQTMRELDRLQQNDTLCYTVQAALDTERRTFEDLFREPSRANQAAFSEACVATEAAIGALPFDYGEIGQERYARTWNLRSGYAGYRNFREEILNMDPAAEDYSARFYRAVEMLDDLSVYALRLSRATLEQGSEAYRQILSGYKLLPLLNAALVLVAATAVWCIFRLLGKSLVQPVLQMAAQSRQIAENDFSQPELYSDSDDEVGELIHAFNRMKQATRDHIKTLEEKNRIESVLHREAMEKLELEKNLDRTRLEMLKSQVNPHFLFNTLNLISCMARLEDAGNTDRMILSLSGLFRYNLRTQEQEVLLEQELGALDDYIHIQQTRFDGRIVYRKQVLVDPGQVRLPSFTLQPLVENAFVHGLARREAGGRIFLRIWQEGTMLYISIADNGCGMTPDRLRELRCRLRDSEHTGIGLGNISRRITMLYPEGGLRIYSKPNRGTVIQCIIPQKQGGEE